jgi:hypothetical protein
MEIQVQIIRIRGTSISIPIRIYVNWPINNGLIV